MNEAKDKGGLDPTVVAQGVKKGETMLGSRAGANGEMFFHHTL